MLGNTPSLIEKTDLMKNLSFTQLNLKVVFTLVFGIMMSAFAMNAQAQGCVINAQANNLPVDWGGATSGTFNAFVDVSDAPADETIVNISVDINMNHTFAGDLDIFLIAPNGQQAHLYNSVCGSSDMSAANTLTFDDAGGNEDCTSPLPTQTIAPVQAGGTAIGNMVFANTSDLNGPWTVQFVDNFGGDAGTVIDLFLNIETTGECGAEPGEDECEITCPTDEVINLDPGLCCSVYSWEIGLNEFCGVPPINGFTENFAYENNVGSFNTQYNCSEIEDLVYGPAGYPPGADYCDFVATEEDELVICSGDVFGGENTCDLNFTFYYWQTPAEPGTVTFDWEVATPTTVLDGTSLVISPMMLVLISRSSELACQRERSEWPGFNPYKRWFVWTVLPNS